MWNIAAPCFQLRWKEAGCLNPPMAQDLAKIKKGYLKESWAELHGFFPSSRLFMHCRSQETPIQSPTPAILGKVGTGLA